MGVATRNDGSIERADLDGQKRITIVREGYTRPAALPVYHSPLEPLRS
jgi:rRNA maturation protein Rpf1